MQDSSAFQFIAIDLIDESTTNPRLTFDQSKLEELAASIRQHGVIQPITVRPLNKRFEIVAGARRFRAAQIAEQFSLPARIKDLTDAEAMEWQLVENSQRVDVHPYEEGQGFQRLLELPGYDVNALVEKSGKSASHIYARLSLLQLIPDVARAFIEERITASHANLIARLPQEHQAAAFENSWRKDWQDKEAHLLPAKHLSAWIQANLYLNLSEAPFDREDNTLKPEAGACIHCPRRSGYNTSLFADVQGDQCLDASCFQAKVNAHIDRQVAMRPELVTIETAWRAPKEQRPGALLKHQYRELADPDNPDAEPPCPSAKSAIIVFGRNVGRTLTVCLDDECAVHTNRAPRLQVAPPPVLPEAPAEETPEEAAQRVADHEAQLVAYRADEERKENERNAELEKERQEHEAEQARRDQQRNARLETFESVLANAPASFSLPQLRLFLSALIHVDPYDLIEDAAAFYAGEDENNSAAAEEVLDTVLTELPDEKLTQFALRLALTAHRSIPRAGARDFLALAADVLSPPPAPASKPAKKVPKAKPTVLKAAVKKAAPKRKAA